MSTYFFDQIEGPNSFLFFKKIEGSNYCVHLKIILMLIVVRFVWMIFFFVVVGV